jgi:lipopolysaccharide export LptBFGC system permease protein LptF
MSAEIPAAAKQTASRAIHFSPFGRHTRYMLSGYLRHVFLVASVLLAIALTIDLWPQFQIVATGQGENALAAVWNVVRFSGLRTPWLIAPFLPFATFLGVLWTEVVHTQSGERMLIWNSGRSPIQCLAPVVLLGIILGAGEFVLDAYLGPAAMGVQMKERLGLDGQRLDRTRRSDPSWIALPDGLVETEIEYGPPPVLHHMMFLKHDAAGQLTEVDLAAVARRQPGTKLWLMRDGHYWTTKPALAPRPTVTLGKSARELMVPFATRTLFLDIDPNWLSVFGMEPQYLPLHVLRMLTLSDRDPESRSRYHTRLQVLYGETVLPGAMALLAATLSMLLLAYGTPAPAVVGIVFVGYLAHFGTKACLLMGQTGTLAPVLAGSLVPASLLGLTLVLLGIIEWQRGGRRSRTLSAE